VCLGIKDRRWIAGNTIWFFVVDLGGTVHVKVERTAVENGTVVNDKNSSPTSDRAAGLISQSEEVC